MRDLDLGLLEVLIVFFFFMPLIRPYIKALWTVEGFVLCPPLALVCLLGIFFSWGFRPECVPLLLYIIIVNIANTNALGAYISHLHTTGFIERNIVLFLIHAIALAFSACVALFFLPLSGSAFITNNVQNTAIEDIATGNEYTVRVYREYNADVLALPPAQRGGGEAGEPAAADSSEHASEPAAADGSEHASEPAAADGSEHASEPAATDSSGHAGEPAAAIKRRAEPVVLVAPPLIGSFKTVDAVCAALAARGNTVVSFSRKGLDLPGFNEHGRAYLPTMRQIVQNWNVLTRGAFYNKENAAGRELEEYRRQDIRFLLSYLSTRMEGRPVIIIGYGVGGAAAVTLSADSAFIDANRALCGVIAVESLLYAAFTPGPEVETRDLPAPFTVLTGAWKWLVRRKPLKLVGVAAMPPPLVPVCFVVSGTEPLDARKNPRYAAVYKTADASGGKAAALALPDTVIFDWTDVPQKYPVLRFVAAQGEPPAWAATECIDNAANQIQRYIILWRKLIYEN